MNKTIIVSITLALLVIAGVGAGIYKAKQDREAKRAAEDKAFLEQLEQERDEQIALIEAEADLQRLEARLETERKLREFQDADYDEHVRTTKDYLRSIDNRLKSRNEN